MKNTFGQNVSITLFGESHGPYIGAVIDGLSPGIEINKEFIASQLDKRRPKGKISTSRRESDNFSIISGVFEGKSSGTPICILIPNENTKSKDYSLTKDLARPGHADFTALCKYHGFQDYRGGGHFSGRITAALVAAGAICIDALRKKGIYIGTHVKKCALVCDREFQNIEEDIKALGEKDFAVLDESKEAIMKEAIEKAAKDGDSVGGILETAIIGLPKGLGEPWFDSIESVISHIMFSIPAVKGIEFGLGFDMADKFGSEINDSFCIKDGNVVTKTNNNGGINGGITNGMPVVFRTVVKPTPSIYKEQETINMATNEEKKLTIEGRHDPAIVHRARIVADSVCAIELCDILAGRYGTDWLKG